MEKKIGANSSEKSKNTSLSTKEEINPKTIVAGDKDAEKEKLSENKFKMGQTFLIGLGFMTCMVAWSMYNFYIPRILAGHLIDDQFFRVGYFRGEGRLFWTNLIMTLDNIIAITLQSYFGELSDRLQSKFGRRTPFVVVGVAVSSLCLLLLPFVPLISMFIYSFVSLIIIIVIFNFAMAFYRAPVVALMPDLTPSEHRSTANMIINIVGGVGGAIGFIIPAYVLKIKFVSENIVGYTTFENQNFFYMDLVVFWSTGIIMLIILLLYILVIREVPTGESFWKIGTRRFDIDPVTREIMPLDESQTIKYNTITEIKGLFSLEEKSAAFMFLAILFWAAAEDTFTTDLSLWATEYASLPDSLTGLLSIVMGLFVVIFGIPAVILSKKKGRIWTLRAGLSFLMLSFLLITIFQEFYRSGVETAGIAGIMIGLGLKGLGGALMAIAAITVVWQLSPKDKTGTYTGLYYVFKQLGSVMSPLIYGTIYSAFSLFMDKSSAWVSFVPYCMILSFLGLLMMRHVKRGEIGDGLTEEEIRELEAIYGTDDD